MDEVVNRFARELADAIAAAVAENPQVEACREKARAAGFEMKVTLEAVVGFVSRSQTAALAKVTAPARVVQPRSRQTTAASSGRCGLPPTKPQNRSNNSRTLEPRTLEPRTENLFSPEGRHATSAPALFSFQALISSGRQCVPPAPTRTAAG